MCILQECKHNLNKKNMKKVLFLLLVTSISYGQALFDKGVKITGGQTTTTATNKIISQEANGVLNQINATSLPISTATSNALDLRTENSSGAIQGFSITNNGNGTVNIATGTAYLRQANDPYSPIIKYVIPAVTNLALTDNANNFVLVDYNGGSPSLTVTTSPGTINTTTNSIAYLISRVGTTLDYISLVGQNVDANGKLRRRFLNIESLRRAQGAVLTSSNRNLLVTSGLFYSGLTEVNTPLFNTSTVDTFTQVYINGTWTRSTGNTQVNNTQYSLGGILTAMPTNDYRVDYVYLLADNPSKLYVLLGTTTYNNITSARLSPVPVDLPSELQYLGTRIGRVIIQKNATIMETSSEYATIYQAGSAQLHNDLGGLNLGDFQHLTVAEKANLEVITNKQNSLAVDGTGIKYPTVDATNAGLALKQNVLTNPITGTGTSNTIPKFTGTTTQGPSNITDNGILVSTSTDMSVNGITVGRGATNNQTNSFFGTLGGQQVLAGSVNNSVFGSLAFRFFSVGSNNFAAGSSAGNNSLDNSNLTTASNSIFIGALTKANANSETNQIVIGVNGQGLGSNTTVIGNSSTTFGRWWGRLLIGKSSDDGINDIQANSFISSGDVTSGVSQPTANNQVTRKDYVDTALALKANLASPTFTGVPSVPTASLGTATGQIASTLFVRDNYISSSGNQTIFGVKSMTHLSDNLSYFNFTTSATNPIHSPININVSSTGSGVFKYITGSGAGDYSENIGSGKGYRVVNVSTGVAFSAETVTNPSIATGNLFEFKYGGVITSKFNNLGELTSPKITMTGTIELKSYTVATLPTGVEGATAYVTDAIAPIYLGALTGGGTVKCPVFYNGTIWVSH